MSALLVSRPKQVSFARVCIQYEISLDIWCGFADVIVRVVWAASDKSPDLAGVFQECLTFESSVAAFSKVCCIDQWDRYTPRQACKAHVAVCANGSKIFSWYLTTYLTTLEFCAASRPLVGVMWLCPLMLKMIEKVDNERRRR
jgi:hypothetical protein